jgi:hypothetical protein
LNSSGLPWADSGYYAIGDYAWYVSDCTLCSASPATLTSMGYCRKNTQVMGRSRGGAVLQAARRNAIRQRRQPGMRGPRAAAEAARRNVTKPHRPQTYNRDAGHMSGLVASGRAGDAHQPTAHPLGPRTARGCRRQLRSVRQSWIIM